MEWTKRGDGAGNPNYGALVMRNMLVSPGFAQAVQRVPKPGVERETMGPYLPTGAYTTRKAFEARGCEATGKHKRRRARLRLRVRPERPRAGRRTRFRFTVRRVKAGRSRPARGATVSLAGHRVKTGKRGRARLVTTQRPGAYRVRATQRGAVRAKRWIRAVSRPG
jgi:hypothetical protein